jgi:hypothetical protein
LSWCQVGAGEVALVTVFVVLGVVFVVLVAVLVAIGAMGIDSGTELIGWRSVSVVPPELAAFPGRQLVAVPSSCRDMQSRMSVSRWPIPMRDATRMPAIPAAAREYSTEEPPPS